MSTFIGTCIQLPVVLLDKYDDSERTIGNRTFRKLIGSEQYLKMEKDLGYDKSLRLSKDWHVSYGKGKWNNKQCACLHWSGIHHIFIL